MQKEFQSYFLAFLAAMLWGTTAAVGKIMLEDLNNIQILLCTAPIAAIFLLGLTFIQGKAPKLKSYGKRDFLRFAYMGFLGVFLYYVFLFAGLQNAPAQQAFIVNYTWPIWVVIFARIFLGEALTLRKILAILLGFVGVYVVATEGDISSFSFQYLKGDLFAIAGAITYGVFSVLSKKHDDDRLTATMLYYSFAFMFTALLVPFVTYVPAITAAQIPGLLWLGAITSGLAFVFWLSALKHGDTAKMSNIIFLTPFLSLVYIYFLTGETIKVSSVIGCGLIVAGILIQSKKTKQDEAGAAT